MGWDEFARNHRCTESPGCSSFSRSLINPQAGQAAFLAAATGGYAALSDLNAHLISTEAQRQPALEKGGEKRTRGGGRNGGKEGREGKAASPPQI